MKYILSLFVFLMLGFQSFGTAQVPDFLVYEGDTMMLFSLPLESHPNKSLFVPEVLFGKEYSLRTDAWRGYSATWEIEEGRLYLVAIYNPCYALEEERSSDESTDELGVEYADLQSLFPTQFKEGRVAADWFSGNLFAPFGECLFYVHDGFESIYEKELEFGVENGMVVARKEWDNSKTRKSVYTTDFKKLNEFIVASINWDNLPQADGIVRKVFVRISLVNEEGKITEAVVARGVGEPYDTEAVRVVKMLPEWEVIYRHGKVRRSSWVLPVTFYSPQQEAEAAD